MIETFIALTFAHIVADYVLQPDWMVANKRNPLTLLTHTAIVLALTMAAIGRVDSIEILGLAAVHLAVDALKTRYGRNTLTSHLTGQTVHFITIIALTFFSPDLWASGIWSNVGSSLPHAMLLIAGIVFITRAGSVAIEHLMRSLTPQADTALGLPQGGKIIGYLERGLIFGLVLGGQAGSIGFLIAAKSILRFGTVNEDRSASEYVIIGTLASFGWAILAALAITKLQSALPPLEIAPLRP